MSKIGLMWMIVLSLLISLVATWYFTVRRPQIDAAVTFLEALRQRNEALLRRVTNPEEVEIYKNLYLRNGYNKHLLKYGELKEKSANSHFFPTQSNFSVTVDEDDMLFGRRSAEYRIALERKDNRWRVLQFASPQDFGDLDALKQFKPAEPVPIH